jgi:hypothetical protein
MRSLKTLDVDNWFDPVLQTQAQKQKIHFWWSTNRHEQTVGAAPAATAGCRSGAEAPFYTS